MRSETTTLSERSRQRTRSGFTLVELLVVVAIVLALTTMTIMSINFSMDADRMREGARQLQSLLAGARDKAIYAKEMRGIRLIRDPNDSHSVTAIQYIGAPAKFTAGTVSIDPPASGGDGKLVSVPSIFDTFKNRGLIRVGSRIQIPRSTGRWYTIVGFPATQKILLTQKYAEFYSSANFSNLSYQLELQPQPLADSTPVQLPKGVVIDLDGSQVPLAWRPNTFTGAYSNQMDILFSPKGLPAGDVVSLGMIHLHIADVGDVVKWQQILGRNATIYASSLLPMVPADDPSSTTPVVKRDRILLTMSTRTGNVSVHPVNVTNTIVTPTAPIENQYLADDPFYFAETGQVAGK